MSSRAGAGAGCPDYLDKLLPALPDAASLLRRISVVSTAGVTYSGIATLCITASRDSNEYRRASRPR